MISDRIKHCQLYDCEYSSVVDRLPSPTKQFTKEIFTNMKLKVGAAIVNTISSFNSRLPITRTFKGNRKKFYLSGARREVTEGEITVNVGRKSTGNRFWFELARVRVIGRQLQ